MEKVVESLVDKWPTESKEEPNVDIRSKLILVDEKYMKKSYSPNKIGSFGISPATQYAIRVIYLPKGKRVSGIFRKICQILLAIFRIFCFFARNRLCSKNHVRVHNR